MSVENTSPAYVVISSDDAAPGSVTARPVFNLQGDLLVDEGAMLDDRAIARIKSWGVGTICVAVQECCDNADQPVETGDKESSRFQHRFDKASGNTVMNEIVRVAIKHNAEQTEENAKNPEHDNA